MKNVLLVAPFLAAMSAASSAATLIFADNFNAGDSPSLDASSQAGRTSGLLADTLQIRSARIQHTIVSNQLNLLKPAAGSGRVRFHDVVDGVPVTGGTGVGWHDFATGPAGAAILADGGFEVSFDWTPPNNTSTNWVSWNVGLGLTEPGTRVNDPATDFGILFRHNGAAQYFDNATATTLDGAFAATLDPRHVVMSFQLSSFADGSNVAVSAWVDGTEVVNGYTFEWDGNGGALFMELGGNEAGNRIDNFQITTIPEPGAALLASLAFGVLLRRRR